MLYVKFSGNKLLAVVQEAAMRAAIPASLPPNPSADDLRPFGYAPLPVAPVPDGLYESETHRYGYEAKLSKDGQWRREVVLEPVEDTDIAPRKIRKTKEAKDKRDALLAGSDWTQLPDAPVDKEAWAQYRQALRDLPATGSFPWSIQWPKVPT